MEHIARRHFTPSLKTSREDRLSFFQGLVPRDEGLKERLSFPNTSSVRDRPKVPRLRWNIFCEGTRVLVT